MTAIHVGFEENYMDFAALLLFMAKREIAI